MLAIIARPHGAGAPEKPNRSVADPEERLGKVGHQDLAAPVPLASLHSNMSSSLPGMVCLMRKVQ
jgi:hypothetical protein